RLSPVARRRAPAALRGGRQRAPDPGAGHPGTLDRRDAPHHAMTTRVHVVLVPGFFGFANLGDLAYFGHVHAFLRDAGAARVLEALLDVGRTERTASLPRRAARVAETLRDEATGDAPVHLVGHSSGGLDCRLLLDPGVRRELPFDPAPLVARV